MTINPKPSVSGETKDGSTSVEQSNRSVSGQRPEDARRDADVLAVVVASGADKLKLLPADEQSNVLPKSDGQSPPSSPPLAGSTTATFSPKLAYHRMHRSNSACVANTTIPAQFASRMPRRNTQVFQSMSIVVEPAFFFSPGYHSHAADSLHRSSLARALTRNTVAEKVAALDKSNADHLSGCGGVRLPSYESMDSGTPPSTPITKHVTLDELIMGIKKCSSKILFKCIQTQSKRRFLVISNHCLTSTMRPIFSSEKLMLVYF